jgi:hypothetical protein
MAEKLPYPFARSDEYPYYTVALGNGEYVRVVLAGDYDALKTDNETRQTIETVYWNLRATMEHSTDCIPSPNPIWGYMNELYDDVNRLEELLDIPNRMEQ